MLSECRCIVLIQILFIIVMSFVGIVICIEITRCIIVVSYKLYFQLYFGYLLYYL